MVMRGSNAEDAGETFRLQPNRSMRWTDIQRVLTVFGLFTAMIAVAVAALGAWPVLPFTGLELLLLAGAFYLNARQGSAREVISLHSDRLELYRGNGRQHDRPYRLPRPWTRVELARDPAGRYPSRLFLNAHGRRHEVGAWLPEHERRRLARDLTRALGTSVS
ncbi:putative membrane protein [Thioalbus denitrificans]|uniref:Putative membrane protein n=2 Tax=Thioalbus denitrificans TaxID=547122 RepID=A0A369CB97_9GAMM|nr:putative membrane protein [Thioalbus denitrificans]